MIKYYLAIDLGATSGRHVIGYKKNSEIILEEIYRFNTGMTDSENGLVWDIARFFNEIKNGLKIAFKKYNNIESVAIDSWGVDYVLMNKDKEIPPFYSYRNARNEKAAKELHKLFSFEELYKRTGIQFASYNTIYQLFGDLKENRLENATDYLMLPSYFSYKLTGIKNHEYCEESTGALLNPYTREYNKDILQKIGFPSKLFNNLNNPGTVLGYLTDEIAKEVGGQTRVVLCPSHDTASAFEAIDAPEDAIIISSGTWSLLGIKLKDPICNEASLKANFTNEGGVNYVRFLKNIMGMWIANQISEQENIDFISILDKLNEISYNKIFDVNDASLIAPKNMKKAVLELLKPDFPINDYELFASVFNSLAFCYKKTCDELESITNKKYKYIYIVGGGAKNKFLNALIEKYTGKKVVALPIEATCLGNIKTQMKNK